MLYYNLVPLSNSAFCLFLFFDRPDLIMTSITLPQFKLRWLDDAGKQRARSLSYNHVRALQQREGLSSDDGSEDGHFGPDDVFALAIPKLMRAVQTPKWISLRDSPKDLGRLKNFPIVMKLFLKFNSLLVNQVN
jgi:hypothetical protein